MTLAFWLCVIVAIGAGTIVACTFRGPPSNDWDMPVGLTWVIAAGLCVLASAGAALCAGVIWAAS